MAKRNWKRVQPRNLTHAMEMCVEFAKDVHNLSVERIADRMGVASHWTVYKWLDGARIPAHLIRPFEHACGVSFVTQYLAASDHKLLVPMPSARPANSEDLLNLHQSFAQAIATLTAFYQGTQDAEAAKAELARHMAEVASHRARVERIEEPELELFGSEDRGMV